MSRMVLHDTKCREKCKIAVKSLEPACFRSAVTEPSALTKQKILAQFSSPVLLVFTDHVAKIIDRPRLRAV